ncbi:molecular chaperone [uncultured Acinetobacter sp.]|uniref:fimbrial biogenesis chaperone n=1 Tax=Acinetobacter soli TaxID=487316 RepID=UPI00242B3ED9|nr:molecular chaperone [uncultured Acinetobacter sp.]
MRLNSVLLGTLFAATLSVSSTSFAAVQALASRVVYNGEYKAATLAVKNNASKDYMLQSWLEPGEAMAKDAKVPLVVTPPLVKINAGKETTLRFIYSGSGLPTDQESQFWINLQEIPPKPENENVLQLAVRTKIKLFYRPQQIGIELRDAVKQLRWFVDGNTLKLENKSPLFVTIGDLTLENQTQPVTNLNKDMVAPFESIEVIKSIPETVSKIHYTYINEYGGNVSMPTVPLR